MSTNSTTPTTTVYVSLTDFGAVGDGITNNQTAIQNAFNYASAHGEAVYIPPGSFAYSGTITANGIAVYGAGSSSILKPQDVANESLILTGSGGSISNLQMVSSATTRLTTPWSAMIWADKASNYTIQNVLINGSSSGGIFNDGSTNGQILNNTVQGTLADSITAIDGSSFLTIQGNRVVNAGDDGISVVSYSDQPIDHDITIQNNTVLNNLSGRGITTVGGNNVQIIGNHVEGGPAGVANIYIGAESQWATQGVNNVVVTGNTLINGGGAPSGTGQGAITIFNNEAGTYTVAGVTISGNQIVNPLNNAVQYVGNGIETGVAQNNTVYTANTSWGFSSSGDAAATLSESGNQLLSSSAYSQPLVAAGGGVSTTTTTPTPPPTPTTPSTVSPDVLTLHLSEDAYKGNAQFIAKVDGVQINQPTAVTALHSKGQVQDFTYQGTWAAGLHTLEIDFINDAYGGRASLDRNLYVNQPTYDGLTAAAHTTALFSNSSVVFTIGHS